MIDYARRYRLDGIDDTLCLVIADIRHQGWGTSAEIITALRSPKRLDNLLEIGEDKYSGRVAVLRHEIKALTDEGALGKRKYSATKNDFV